MPRPLWHSLPVYVFAVVVLILIVGTVVLIVNDANARADCVAVGGHQYRALCILPDGRVMW